MQIQNTLTTQVYDYVSSKAFERSDDNYNELLKSSQNLKIIVPIPHNYTQI